MMVGEFVYHCHIVGHEDAGMMQNIEVVQPRSTVAELWDMVRNLASNELPDYLGGGTLQTVADEASALALRRVGSSVAALPRGSGAELADTLSAAITRRQRDHRAEQHRARKAAANTDDVTASISP